MELAVVRPLPSSWELSVNRARAEEADPGFDSLNHACHYIRAVRRGGERGDGEDGRSESNHHVRSQVGPSPCNSRSMPNIPPSGTATSNRTQSSPNPRNSCRFRIHSINVVPFLGVARDD